MHPDHQRIRSSMSFNMAVRLLSELKKSMWHRSFPPLFRLFSCYTSLLGLGNFINSAIPNVRMVSNQIKWDFAFHDLQKWAAP